MIKWERWRQQQKKKKVGNSIRNGLASNRILLFILIFNSIKSSSSSVAPIKKRVRRNRMGKKEPSTKAIKNNLMKWVRLNLIKTNDEFCYHITFLVPFFVTLCTHARTHIRTYYIVNFHCAQ